MSEHRSTVRTGGGAFVNGSVDVRKNGEFVGRDRTVHGDDVGGDKVLGSKFVYQGPGHEPLNYYSEAAGILDYYTPTFVGRQREWQEVARFAAQESPGYLLIESPAGYGKSAFVAHLVHLHRTGRWDRTPVPELLFFFIRQEGQRNTAGEFLKALNSQLLTVLRQPGSLPSDTGALHSQFSQLWPQAAARASIQRPLLLLVDGLDEMAPGVVTIAHRLPASLTPYVHVVVTSRPNPEPLHQVSLEHPFRKAIVRRLNTFSNDEIQDLLRKLGVAEGEAARLAPRVQAMTKGEPLFARFVCQEVQAEGAPALARLEESPPEDVTDYFTKQFEYLARSARGQLTRRVLGLLLNTLGAISTEEIAEVLEEDKWSVEEAIVPIKRFLLGQDRLELMHLELHRAIERQFGRRDRRRYEQQVLQWCRSYGDEGWPRETPDYVLSHYARHLAEAGRQERLYGLVDQSWMTLKFERTRSYRSFAEDVALLIETAEAKHPPNLAQVVRGSLIYATLGSLAADVPAEILGVLVQVGQAVRAEDYAGLMQDPARRYEAYSTIASALQEQEDLVGAKRSWHRALDAAAVIEDRRDRAAALNQVAGALAILGEGHLAADTIRQALTAAVEIGHSWYRQEALQQLKEVLERLENTAQVLEAVNRAFAPAVAESETSWGRAELMADWATALVWLEEWERAVDMAGQAIIQAVAVEDSDQYPTLGPMKQMVHAILVSRQPQAVLAVMADIDDPNGRRYTLAAAVPALLAVEDPEQVVALLDGVLASAAQSEAPRDRQLALSWLAQTLAQIAAAGDEGLVDWQIQLPSWLAQSPPQPGLEDWAVAAAEQAVQLAEQSVTASIEESDWSPVWLGLAYTLLPAESESAALAVSRGLAVAEGIPEPWARYEVYEQWVRLLARLDWRGQAASAASQAIAAACQAVAEFQDPYRRWFDQEPLEGLTAILVHQGETEQAKLLEAVAVAGRAWATASMSEGPDLQQETEDRLATVLIGVSSGEQGDDAAQRIIEAVIQEPSLRQQGLELWAQALIRLGETDQAMAAAVQIEDSWRRLEIFQPVADRPEVWGLADSAGQITDRALDAASTIEDPELMLRSLRYHGDSLTGDARRQRALAATDAVLAMPHRISVDALVDLAAILISVGEVDRAREVVEHGLTRVAEIEYHWEPEELRTGFVRILGQAGDLDRAFEIAASTASQTSRCATLLELANTVATSGDRQMLVKAVNQVLAAMVGAWDWWLMSPLSRLVTSLFQLDEFDLALDLAGAIEDPTSRQRILDAVIEWLSQLDEREPLLAAIEQSFAAIEAIEDEASRSEALVSLAESVATWNEVAQAVSAIERAVTVATRLEEPLYRSVALGHLARMLGRIDGHKPATDAARRALRAARSVEDAANQQNTLTLLAPILVQLGEKDRALAAVDLVMDAAAAGVGGERAKADGLRKVASALALTGRLDQAAVAAHQVLTATEDADEQERAKALESVAPALVGGEDLDWLMAKAKALGSEADKAKVLAAIAGSLARSEQTDEAWAIAQEIFVAKQQTFAMGQVVEALARRGEVDLARERLAVIPESRQRAEAQVEIVVALAERGEVEEALALASEIRGARPQAEAAWRMSLLLARSGQGERARQIAEGIENPAFKARALGQVAEALAREGASAKAKQTVKMVLASVAEAGDEWQRAVALGRVGRALDRLGEADDLGRLLAEVGIEHKRAQVDALCRLAQNWARAGEHHLADRAADEALVQARQIAGGRARAIALRSVAVAQAYSGRVEQAQQVVGEIREGKQQAMAMTEVALALARVGRNTEACQTLSVAFSAARLSGRASLFNLLYYGTAALAAIDGGNALGDVFEVVREVEGWWHTE